MIEMFQVNVGPENRAKWPELVPEPRWPQHPLKFKEVATRFHYACN